VKRLEVLEDLELAELTEGMTIDKIFGAKSLKEHYSNEKIIDIFKNNFKTM